MLPIMEFQRHYAKISQEMGCEMHIAGCEMVMSEHREKELGIKYHICNIN